MRSTFQACHFGDMPTEMTAISVYLVYTRRSLQADTLILTSADQGEGANRSKGTPTGLQEHRS